MISINFTSLIDLLAFLLTGAVAFVFSYHYWRVSRRQPDLYFSLVLQFLLIQTGIILVSDNVVPYGRSAWSVPGAAEQTLLCARLLWVNGLLVLATVTLFALRYTGNTHLLRWKGALLYVLALLVGWFCWTNNFLILRKTPYAEFISWTCLVPWWPEPGKFCAIPLVLLLSTVVYVLYLVLRGSRQEMESPTNKVHSRLVTLGVVLWAVGGMLDAALGLMNYFGVSPSALLGAVAMLIVGVGLAEEHAVGERERRHVTRRFQSYVDPALVKYVIEHPESGHIDGVARELTVVFTDLEGFTKITEQLREGAVELVNEYLRLMTPLIRDHNGYRNKFLGDGMMFFYGAPDPNPDHAIHAVATVLKMEETMVKLNDVLSHRGLLRDGVSRLRMRTGVSTGQMIVGDAGPDDASDYTVLGDTVNLGSRLESANKALGTRILLSERTVELLPKDLFLVRPIARLQVVGVARIVMTYEPLTYARQATDAHRQLVDLTRQIVEPFLRADFDACLEAVERFERELGPGKLSSLYRRQCEYYRANAVGPDFVGQIVLSEK